MRLDVHVAFPRKWWVSEWNVLVTEAAASAVVVRRWLHGRGSTGRAALVATARRLGLAAVVLGGSAVALAAAELDVEQVELRHRALVALAVIVRASPRLTFDEQHGPLRDGPTEPLGALAEADNSVPVAALAPHLVLV